MLIVLKLLAGILMNIVGILLLPFILLFIDKDRETLPRAFRWLDNHEAHINPKDRQQVPDGLAGGEPYRRPRGIYPYGPYNFFKLWLWRYIWLAWRNPSNYFGYVVLGFEWTPYIRRTHFEGNPNTGDFSEEGSYSSQVFDVFNQKIYKEYYLVHKWGNSGKCLRVRIGYKIGPPERTHHHGHYVQYVFSIIPYKTYNGK